MAERRKLCFFSLTVRAELLSARNKVHDSLQFLVILHTYTPYTHRSYYHGLVLNNQQQPLGRVVGSSSTTNKLPRKLPPPPLPGRCESLRDSTRRLAMLAKSSLMPRPDFAEVSKYCAPTDTA